MDFIFSDLVIAIAAFFTLRTDRRPLREIFCLTMPGCVQTVMLLLACAAVQASYSPADLQLVKCANDPTSPLADCEKVLAAAAVLVCAEWRSNSSIAGAGRRCRHQRAAPNQQTNSTDGSITLWQCESSQYAAEAWCRCYDRREIWRDADAWCSFPRPCRGSSCVAASRHQCRWRAAS